MNQTIIVRDYNKRPVEVVVTDFENVRALFCEVISGDEVLFVFYDDGTSVTFDMFKETRLMGFFDGCVMIPLDKISEFNNIEDYEVMLKTFTVERGVK